MIMNGIDVLICMSALSTLKSNKLKLSQILHFKRKLSDVLVSEPQWRYLSKTQKSPQLFAKNSLPLPTF